MTVVTPILKRGIKGVKHQKWGRIRDQKPCSPNLGGFPGGLVVLYLGYERRYPVYFFLQGGRQLNLKLHQKPIALLRQRLLSLFRVLNRAGLGFSFNSREISRIRITDFIRLSGLNLTIVILLSCEVL